MHCVSVIDEAKMPFLVVVLHIVVVDGWIIFLIIIIIPAPPPVLSRGIYVFILILF
jgi:hypothetical protein